MQKKQSYITEQLPIHSHFMKYGIKISFNYMNFILNIHIYPKSIEYTKKNKENLAMLVIFVA